MTTTTRLRAIGIDVGFFATKYTTGRVAGGHGRSAIATGQFPSVAPFQHVESPGAADAAREGVRLTVDGVSHAGQLRRVQVVEQAENIMLRDLVGAVGAIR